MLFFGQATLVQDINQGNGSSNPSNKIVFNGEAYFAAYSETFGTELWKTDGTEAGTVMVKDIVVGEGSAFTSEFKVHELNGELLFFVQTSFNEHDLWKTDGTEAGTVMVKDLPSGNLLMHTDINGALLFSIGNDLWKSDATESGTNVITNRAIFGNRYVKHNNVIYYSGYGTNSQGNELFKTDGTAAGTVLVKDIRPGSSNSFPTNFGEANGIIFFTANDGANGNELWKTDGTEVGTEMIKDISPGSTNSFTYENPNESFNNEYFIHFNTELWKSDGTEAGTVQVKDVGYVKGLRVFNNKLHVFNFDTTFWESDGTTAGTNEVVTDCEEFFHFGTTQQAVVGNEYYFQGRNECHYQLWKTDGTAQGTVMVKAILPVWDDGHIQHIIDFNGQALLTANDGTWHGNELWISDGSSSGTVMLKDINPTGNSASSPNDFFDFNGTLIFSADNGENGRELWKKEGSGTTMIKDINEGNLFGDPKGFIMFNNEVYFKATTKLNGTELWKTDGTEAGTVMVKDINPNGENGLFNTGNFVELNGKLYFYANNGVDGFELWESDGTEAGTVMVKDINIGPENSIRNGELIVFNNKILFNARDTSNDYELWESDGTETGTVLLKDLNTNSSGSPDTFVHFNNAIYFKGNTTSGSNVIWKTDGTSAGTVTVSGSPSYPNNLTVSGSSLYFTGGTDLWRTDGVSLWSLIDGYPSALTDHNGTLFFRTNSGSIGYELWKTDGTVSGTTLVKDINTDANQSSNISEMVSYGSYIYFGAGNNSQNKELWRSDGTEAGTVLYQDINPSTEQFGNGSDPKNFFVQDDTLYFSANDGVTNIELWELIDDNLGLEDQSLTQKVRLYPNPTNDNFTIKVSGSLNCDIEIYDIMGNRMFGYSKQNNNTFDVSNLSTGLYMVTIKTQTSTQVIKLIKR